MILTNSANRANDAANRRQQFLTEQGQITERFGRAIDQLGSDKLDVRLGGIYALERLMRDSPHDEFNLIEVLSAFIRGHAGTTERPTRHDNLAMPSRLRLSTDVQAALTVLGRRPNAADYHNIDLSDADIFGADLAFSNLTYVHFHGADLRRADLVGVDLAHADLTGTDLVGADLSTSHLDHANLARALLTRADLFAADLRGANLDRANLAGADLTDANLSHANLADADLSNSHLYGVNLAHAELSGVNLAGAFWPLDTAPPQGWVRDQGRHLLKRSSQ
ncbi:MAG TPA: pentapeptide repeat-containing protein [Anaerolineae bacterium]